MGRGVRKPLTWDSAPRKLSPAARAEMELPRFQFTPGPETTFEDAVRALAEDFARNYEQVTRRAREIAAAEGVTVGGNSIQGGTK